MVSHQPVLNQRRTAALGTSLAGIAVALGLTGAIARNDDGSKTFFLEAAAPVAQFVARGAAASTGLVRDLTAASLPRRLHFADLRQRKLARTGPQPPIRQTTRVAQAAGATAPARAVTIYTDRTLQPGDAVMGQGGIRIFKGTRNFPYHDSDFVALVRAEGLSRTMTRTLASLNGALVPGG